ncbi:MAG: VWA domain-containing protein [Myxococcota bacterium]|nr:VWA domain-containing protein [Myxococcota bacterium]
MRTTSGVSSSRARRSLWLLSIALLTASIAVASPASRAAAQSTVTPYFMVVFDTSGSMGNSTGSGTNSCGQARTRMSDAKCVLQRVVNGYGDVSFGLERFRQSCTGGSCTSTCVTSGCSCSGCSASCTATASSGEVLVPIASDNQSDILRWVDYSCGSCTSTAVSANPELRALGNTPLGGSLLAARSYYAGASSPLIGDPFGTCRPVSVILLTDGDETCSGNAVNAATQLRSTTVDGRTYDIRTYVIGFGISPGDADIENMATAGGTDAPGSRRGFYATDETSLSLAFSQIIEDSIRYEVCDGVDNDCDTRVDEGFTLYCDRPNGVTTARLCSDPGERVCDGRDDNCAGGVDEGLRNLCGTCGTPPAETCDRTDEDCDGAIDEGACSCPSPSPEICDNLDNDCDGTIDEGLMRACGSSVGACMPGSQICSAGTWGMCTGSTMPTSETCNGIDDDCDGVIDGQVEDCGSAVGRCTRGRRACIAGAWGMCIGGIGPATEVCNGVDDNCNGSTDEGDPGGGGACGSSVGACMPGTLRCTAGMLTCTGGTSPGVETCNTLDDDCDGRVDEGNPGGGASCGASMVGECRPGTLQCVTGGLACVGARGPRGELCNGLDDDCDARTDEGNPEAGLPCGDDTGECAAGTTRCASGMLTCEGAVGPTPELCNALDDDCDGAIDDEIPVGAACGTDVGECIPGINVCDSATGMLVCSGEVGPAAEVCNLLDDDCDTRIDEGLADAGPCGSDEGECTAGTLRCVGGSEICVGEVPPGPELCDCIDNDCDAMTDEPPDTGSLCPSGSACVDCQCALPCVMGEFGFDCPTGRFPRVDGGTCFCVAERCDAAICGAETIERDGATVCAPDRSDVAACVCRANECTFACDGVSCAGGLVCDPRDPMGRCVEDDCRGLGCPAGELCDRATGACLADPCVAAGCTAEQACRAGVCEESCAGVECPSGEVCRSGACVVDRCGGVTCDDGEVCDPAGGSCVTDQCDGVSCPAGTRCVPTSGECAVTPCDVLRCPGEEVCVDGECADRVVAPDAGTGFDGGRSDAGRDELRVVAAGGGGCLCSAAGSGPEGARGVAGMLAMIALGLVVSVRRARRRRGGDR